MQLPSDVIDAPWAEIYSYKINGRTAASRAPFDYSGEG